MKVVQRVALVLLATWALGLAITTLKLRAWQETVSGVLMQIQADALLRTHAPRAGASVQPAWYRQRALALLATVEQLHQDTPWSWVMPGSWRLFDDLEERVIQHVSRAFSRMVVETVRHELDTRGAQLTGLALEPKTAALDITGHCRRPRHPDPAPAHALTLAVHQMAEHAALENFLNATEHLDRAVTAWMALHARLPARPDDLRVVVRYSLGADLSRPVSRSLAWFRATPEAADPNGQALFNRLGGALACTADKGMHDLRTRMVAGNPLLKIEAAVAGLLREGLFIAPAGRPASEDDATRLQSVVDLIEAQQSLLAQGDHEWMRPDGGGLGKDHDHLVRRIESITLLGPALASQLRAQAHAEAMRLRHALEEQLGQVDPGLAWDAQAQRFVLSAHRQAVHAGLTALLNEPFMSGGTRPPGASRPDLLRLVGQRQRFRIASLPLFPPSLRDPASRYADQRIALRVLAHSRRFVFAMERPQTFTPGANEDPAQRLAMIERDLLEAGEPVLAQWLVHRLGDEIFRCEPAPACRLPTTASPEEPSDNAAKPAAPASGAD